jgi:plastocyanin
MSENLDSRALRNTDCYGQRFMKPGTYSYALVPAGGVGSGGDYPYIVEVVEKSSAKERDMHQTLVTVRFVKERHGDCCDERTSDPGRFVPDEERVTIEAGDMVMWNSPDAAARPFAVHGQKDFFTSAALTNECGYTHVFMTAGEYEYVDADGSGLRGVVKVTDPKPRNHDELRAWQSRLGEGTLVMISDGRAEPAEVEIMMGQTVFFAIVKGPGITITEASLVADLSEQTSGAA